MGNNANFCHHYHHHHLRFQFFAASPTNIEITRSPRLAVFLQPTRQADQ